MDEMLRMCSNMVRKKGRKYFVAWISGGMMLVLKKAFGVAVSKNDTLFFAP